MEQQEVERIQATALYPGVLLRSEAFVPCDCTPTPIATNISSSNTNAKPILLVLGLLVILGFGFCLGLQMMTNQISLMNKQNQTLQAQNKMLQTQNAQITKELKQTQTAISNFKKCLASSGI